MAVGGRLRALTLSRLVVFALVATACAGPQGDIRALASALGPRRVVEPRLTGGFAYAPCRPVPAAADLVPEPECSPLPPALSPEFIALSAAQEKLFQRDEEAVSASRLHSQALWHLLWAEEVLNGPAEAHRSAVGNSLDQAIDKLERAAVETPGDAEVWSDLAAVRLVRAQRRDQPEGLFQALDASAKALDLQAGLPEALFNQALALELLSLRFQARDAWQAYLALDPESPWAFEAEEHSRALSTSPPDDWEDAQLRLERAARAGDREVVRRLTTRFLQETRLLGEEEALPAWAEAMAAGRTKEAAEALDEARLLGEALAASGSDWMLQEAVAHIDSLRAGGPSTYLENVVSGLRAYREGLDRYHERRMEEAQEPFRSAERPLAIAGSPMAGWATLHRAILAYHRHELESALSLLEPLLHNSESTRHLALEGRAHWLLGLIESRRGRPFESLRAYEAAYSLFSTAGQREDLVVIHQSLHTALMTLGQEGKASEHGYRALRAIPWLPPRRVHTILDEAGAVAHKWGLPRVALFFHTELVRHAEAWGLAEAQAQALYQRAQDLLRLGDLDGAQSDLAAAAMYLEATPDEGLRQTITALGRMAEVEVAAAGAPDQALTALDAVEDFFTPSDQYLFLLRIWRLRSQIYGRQKRWAEAAGELGRAIQWIETQRASLESVELRRSFFDQAKGIYEERITLEAERRGDPEVAFEYTERSRARLLLEALASFQASPDEARGFKPVAAQDLAAELPSGVTLLEYELTHDRLFIWALGGGEVSFAQTSAPTAEVRRLISGFRTALIDKAEAQVVRPLAEALHGLLIAPVAAKVPAGDTLVVVPDEELWGLPFAALRDPGSGRYLIEDHEIRFVPSATWLAQASRAPRTPVEEPLTALVVGDPALGPSFFNLAPLPGSRAEALRIAALFPSTLLLAKEATPARVLAELPRHGVFHLGAHALSLGESPGASAFALAPDPATGDSGALYARDLEGLVLTRCRLAVLAACSTARGETSATEGPLSLARPFLAAGVPSVVATLWEVGDEEAGSFLLDFYEAFQSGLEPAMALRAAQLSRCREPVSTPSSGFAWAGFVVYGT